MKNKHFSNYIEDYIDKIVERDKISKTAVIYKSGLSRPLVYRWINNGLFPRLSNLWNFFDNTQLEKGQQKDEEYWLMIKSLTDEAYQCLLLDFYEKKEHTFI
tara:strand:+ start:1009 stop:1314 length:306 start_codon:yes stop_codon:yes gene_type:complete